MTSFSDLQKLRMQLQINPVQKFQPPRFRDKDFALNGRQLPRVQRYFR